MSSAHDSPGVRLRLHQSEAHPCPYLPGRMAVDQFSIMEDLQPADYQILMDNGFRRSGRIVYRPRCAACSECMPIRVPVEQFAPSRSQRRVFRKNTDVTIEIARPKPTDEKWRVYQSYIEQQHQMPIQGTRESFERFLYESPTETWEMIYRIDGQVGGIGIVDVTPLCLSSVYFFFNPEFRKRGLGVFSAIFEIEECRRRGLPYWYAGFYIRECPRMNYKAQFTPYELICADGQWRLVK